MAITRADGIEVETFIAKEDVEVQDPNTSNPAFRRRVLAGHPVPAELLDAYHAAVGDKSAEAQKAKAERAPARDKAIKAPEASK